MQKPGFDTVIECQDAEAMLLGKVIVWRLQTVKAVFYRIVVVLLWFLITALCLFSTYIVKRSRKGPDQQDGVQRYREKKRAN